MQEIILDCGAREVFALSFTNCRVCVLGISLETFNFTMCTFRERKVIIKIRNIFCDKRLL